jgi:DNA-binding CsgD family transcriptional regulator
MNNMLNPYEYSEDLFNLQDQLKKEFWELAQKILTARQWEVLNLVCEGHTQTEIAKMLGVNQSSIVKTIQGNCDYVHGAKRYGGLIKKMKTAIAKDPKFQEIFTQIQELKEEKL